MITKPIVVGNCCWLTTGVSVLPGVTIGDFSVIAVNSTVVKDVTEGSVVGGNPAKFIKTRVLTNIKFGGGGRLETV